MAELKGLIDLGWFGPMCPDCGGPEGDCDCRAQEPEPSEDPEEWAEDLRTRECINVHRS